jgi:hypothetical protein
MLALACQIIEDRDDDSTLRDDPQFASSGSSDGDGSSDENCFDTGPSAVRLGGAANFAILAKSGVVVSSGSTVAGNVGLSPAGGSSITGLPLTMAMTNDHATAVDVVGKIYAADYKPPTPDALAAAVTDMEVAYANAATRWPDMTGLGVGTIGGMTLPPGVYNWDADVSIPTDVALHGCERDVWIFQVAGDLSMSSMARVDLVGGAKPGNVFWQVGGQVDIGPGAHFEGILLTKSAVTLHTGASVDGRLLVLTSVSLDGSSVIAPP